MRKSIETIWKEGFLQSNALIVPKLNNLYDQRSKHLLDKLKFMFRINLIVMLIMAIIFLIVYYLLDAMLLGICFAISLIALALFTKNQMQKIKKIDQGTSSYDYLKSFSSWLKNTFSKNVKIMRLFYPLNFLIAISTIWFAGNNQIKLTNMLIEKFGDLTFIGGIPLFGIVAVCFITILIACFSDRIYMWDVRLVYGRVFDKLEETIAEMEKLKAE
jgi:hypothetical protein